MVLKYSGGVSRGQSSKCNTEIFYFLPTVDTMAGPGD